MATNINNLPLSGRLMNFEYAMKRYWTVSKAEQNPPEMIRFPELKPREREDSIAFDVRMTVRARHRLSFSRFGDVALAQHFRTQLDAMTNLGPNRPEVEKQISQAAHLLRKSGVLDLIPAVGISESDLLWKMSFGHMRTDFYKCSSDKYLVGCLKSFENGSIGNHVYIDHFATETSASEVELESVRRRQVRQDRMLYLEPAERFQLEQAEMPKRDIFAANRRVQYPVTYLMTEDDTRYLRVAVYSTKHFPKQHRHGEINIHAKLALVDASGVFSDDVHLYFKLGGKKRRASLLKVSISAQRTELWGADARRYGKRLMNLFGEGLLDEYRDVHAHVAKLRTASGPRHTVITPTRDELNKWQGTWNFSRGIHEQKLGTTVYFYPHARTLPDFPEIGAHSNAVVIYFGGSGTPKSSGANAMRLANILQRYGVSTIAFDYPFHARGPYDRKYLKGAETMGMMRDIVMHYASVGLPVYLVGHSMGPSRIQELLHTAPEDMKRRLARGALMFSPAVCTERQREIYAELNAAGATWLIDGDVVEGDPVGEKWEQSMDAQTVSLEGDMLDIPMPVKVVASDNDPYSTPDILDEIARRFPDGALEVLQGLGHAGIFEQRVASSGEVVLADRTLRFIEEVAGEKLSKSQQTKTTSRSMFKYLHHHSALFRRWLRRIGKPLEACVKNEKISGGILAQWERWIHHRVYVMAMYTISRMIPESLKQERVVKAKSILDKPYNDISRDDIMMLAQLVIASH